MMVFRLEPISATLDSDSWKDSTHKETLWASAEDEGAARDLAANATSGSKVRSGFPKIPPSPWRNADLVSCTIDPSRKVADGTVVTANGKQINRD